MTEEKQDNLIEKGSSCGCSVGSKSFLLFIVALLALGVVGYALIGDPGPNACGINNADGTAVSCSKTDGCGGCPASAKACCGSADCSADKAACSKGKACCGSEQCSMDKAGYSESSVCSGSAGCSKDQASCSTGQCPATQIVQQNQ